MKTRHAIFLLFFVLLPLSCNLPGNDASALSSVSAGSELLLVAPPGSTPTATPFQPLPPTPTYIPTEFPTPEPVFIPAPAPQINPGEGRTWADYPGPSIWPDIDIPAPTGILPHPEGQINILLLGSDQRPYDPGFRTDTILLLTLNIEEGTAHLTSFPRDLYVYIPGYTVQRINTAFIWGGFDALATTMEYNFGVHPDYYALINLWSFVDVIDSLGGIRVEIGRDLCDHRDAWGEFCVSQGTMWMDGKTALWYVRSRYTTSDFDRGRRQQEVLQGVFNQLISMNGLSRAPELYEIYVQNVTTNMSFGDLAGLIPLAAHLADTGELGRYSIGTGQVYSWTNTSGAMVLVPVRDAVLDVMRQALNSP